VDLKTRFSALWLGLKGPLALFLMLSFLVSFGLSNMEGVFGLFALKRFGFGPSQVGIVMVVVGTVVALVQMVLTGPATKRWGERTIIKSALLGLTVTFLLILTAVDLASLMLTTGLFAFTNAMLRPSISSLVSKETDLDQGFALGLNSSFMSLGRFVGPLLAGFLLDIRVDLPYLAGSLLMFVGFLFVTFMLKKPEEEISLPARS
jgi:DHA1 family multidrug resistance protein-like MFS transporter